MSEKYNKIQAIILIIGFISYATAHALGMGNLKISFIMALSLLNASFQAVVCFLFRKNTKTDTDEIKESKIDRILYKLVFIFSLFVFFVLEFVIISNIF